MFDDEKNYILWTLESYKTLRYIITKITKSKLHDNILTLIKAYIKVHDLDNECRICYMEMIDGSIISLLHILDSEVKKIIILSFTLSLYIRIKYPKTEIIMDSKLTYFAFSRFLSGSFMNYTNFNKWVLSFDESYIINLVADILTNNGNNDKKDYNNTTYNEYNISENTSNNNRRKYLDIVSSCYYFSFKFFQTSSVFLDRMENLLTRTEELDISILTAEQLRDIKDIFNCKRTLYVRIFLVVCNEMLRNRYKFDTDWLNFKCSIDDKTSFDLLFDDPLIEMNIWIASCSILDIYQSNI